MKKWLRLLQTSKLEGSRNFIGISLVSSSSSFHLQTMTGFLTKIEVTNCPRILNVRVEILIGWLWLRFAPKFSAACISINKRCGLRVSVLGKQLFVSTQYFKSVFMRICALTGENVFFSRTYFAKVDNIDSCSSLLLNFSDLN